MDSIIEVYAPLGLQDIFHELVKEVVEEFKPLSIPAFGLNKVDNISEASLDKDYSEGILEINYPIHYLLNNEIHDSLGGLTLKVSTKEVENSLKNFIKQGLLHFQFYDNSDLYETESALLEDSNLIDIVKEESNNYWKTQPFAIHSDVKFASHYLGKLGFNISNRLYEENLNRLSAKFAYHIRTKGLVENLSRTISNNKFQDGEQVLDVWQENKPLGIDLGNPNEQISKLESYLKKNDWKDMLLSKKSWMKKLHSQHPSYELER